MIVANAARRTGALTVALVAAMTLATPALAACGVSAESVAGAEVVFVGTLTFASDDGSVGRFDVEDVWKAGGLVLASPVSVQGAPGMVTMPPPGAGAQVFLVLADAVDGAPTVTGNDCSSWLIPWDDSYAAFRPAGAPPPSGSPTADGGFPAPVVAVGAALLLLAVVGVVAFSRGSAKGA
jgi:hypothetical protein